METKNAIGLNSVIKQADDVVSCDLEGETALMSISKGKYYGLDPVGSHIWALLDHPRSVAELCTLLLEKFEVERSRCESDVLTLFNELAQNNLIMVVDAAIA